MPSIESSFINFDSIAVVLLDSILIFIEKTSFSLQKGGLGKDMGVATTIYYIRFDITGRGGLKYFTEVCGTTKVRTNMRPLVVFVSFSCFERY